MTSSSAVKVQNHTHLEAFEAELAGEVVEAGDAPVVDPELGVEVAPGMTNKQLSKVPGCLGKPIYRK